MSLFESRVSVVCRLLPPTHRVSVSPMEIADARIQLARGREVPKEDPQLAELGGNLRPGADTQVMLYPCLRKCLGFYRGW
jgi:hypothetical protein